MYAIPELFKRKREYPAEYLTYIGNTPPQNDIQRLFRFNNRYIFWEGIGACMAAYHTRWQGIEYALDENGAAYWDADNDNPVWQKRKAEILSQ